MTVTMRACTVQDCVAASWQPTVQLVETHPKGTCASRGAASPKSITCAHTTASKHCETQRLMHALLVSAVGQVLCSLQSHNLPSQSRCMLLVLRQGA